MIGQKGVRSRGETRESERDGAVGILRGNTLTNHPLTKVRDVGRVLELVIGSIEVAATGFECQFDTIDRSRSGSALGNEPVREVVVDEVAVCDTLGVEAHSHESWLGMEQGFLC